MQDLKHLNLRQIEPVRYTPYVKTNKMRTAAAALLFVAVAVAIGAMLAS